MSCGAVCSFNIAAVMSSWILITATLIRKDLIHASTGMDGDRTMESAPTAFSHRKQCLAALNNIPHWQSSLTARVIDLPMCS